MENYSNITTNIIEAINTILGNLFSSIDNNIYNKFEGNDKYVKFKSN